ncbi:MAG: YceI family protein [Leptospiraceae bacterium]|nr:YceI family protein [Leptospiraceae bacterium]MDW7975470.1 YceI family protein [Leptospiraceae bacterium]
MDLTEVPNPNEKTKIKIFFLPDQKEIEVEVGSSILEASLNYGIPHYHVCLGNGVCSTCRVEILEGLEYLPPRNSQEKLIANQKGWKDNIRLACQTIPKGNIKVRRLIYDEGDSRLAQKEITDSQTKENQEATVLVIEIQNFFELIEKTPNVFFSLSHFFQRVNKVLSNFDSYIEKLNQHSLMAIFVPKENQSLLELSLHALYCTKEILEISKEFNETNKLQGIQVQMGLNLGAVIFASANYKGNWENVVFGKTIEWANYLTKVNRKVQTHILISESLYNIAKDYIRIGRKFKVVSKELFQPQLAFEFLELNLNKEEEQKRYLQKPMSFSLREMIEHKDLSQHSLKNIVFEVDKSQSQIVFLLMTPLDRFVGIAKDYEIEINYQVDITPKLNLQIFIPVKNITTLHQTRDETFYAENFFDAVNFPHIYFFSNNIQVLQDREFRSYGNLFLKGITKPISIDFHVKLVDKNHQNPKMGLSGSTKVFLRDFGITSELNYEMLISFELQFWVKFSIQEIENKKEL